MTLNISPEQMARYQATARRRWQAEQVQRTARRERAWDLARQAAALLKAEYNVSRVVVFGSLLQPDRFGLTSDVDLAAWGLTSANWLRAMGTVRYLSDEIELNLVDVGCCMPQLLAVIEREGVEL